MQLFSSERKPAFQFSVPAVKDSVRSNAFRSLLARTCVFSFGSPVLHLCVFRIAIEKRIGPFESKVRIRI